jgi:hypothetical protein
MGKLVPDTFEGVVVGLNDSSVNDRHLHRGGLVVESTDLDLSVEGLLGLGALGALGLAKVERLGRSHGGEGGGNGEGELHVFVWLVVELG